MEDLTAPPMVKNSAVLLFAGLSYSYFIVRKIQNPPLRLLFHLPLFYIFYSFSWSFSSAFLRGVSSFFITWVASFKILLFCFNRGPLTTCETFADFLMISTLPVRIRDMEKNRGAIHHYELVELFKQPHLATSFADFWGRRWNRLGSTMLRLTIYNPTRETVAAFAAPRTARVAAIISTFLVSAAMHELMFYYITCGAKPTFEVTKFFLSQGMFIALEAVFSSRGWAPLNPRVTSVLKRGLIAVSFYRWLVLPVMRSGKNVCKAN